MLHLRDYRRQDADRIVTWVGSLKQLRQWSADSFSGWPLSPEEFHGNYREKMSAQPTFRPLTAVDEGGTPAGHLFLVQRSDDGAVRVGFVIVDPARRGQGLGKEMMLLACRYAFDRYDTDVVSLGVFENNPTAQACYLAAGFRRGSVPSRFYTMDGEKWECLELERVKAPSEGKA